MKTAIAAVSRSLNDAAVALRIAAIRCGCEIFWSMNWKDAYCHVKTVTVKY